MERCVSLLVLEVHRHSAAIQQSLHHVHLAGLGGGVQERLGAHPGSLPLQPRLHHPWLTLPYCLSHLKSPYP